MPWGIKKKFVGLFSKRDEYDDDVEEESTPVQSSFSMTNHDRSTSKSSKKSKRSKSTPTNFAGSGIQSENIPSVLKELECPVCFNTCIPPIIPCTNGHIICSACRKSIERCPTCRGSFSNTRNLFAEQFIQQYARPCKYAAGGCQFLKWKGQDIGPHEAKCYYRNIQCPVPSCRRSIGFKDVLTHLVDGHKVYGTDNLPVMIKYNTEDPTISNRKWLPYYIQAHGCIFYVMLEIARPNLYAWIYVHYSKEEQNKNTMFHSSITLLHPTKHMSVEWKGSVHSIRTPGTKIIKDGTCFGTSENMIQHLEENGIISVLVNIEKRGKSDPVAPIFPFLQGTTRSQASVLSTQSGTNISTGGRGPQNISSSSIELIHRRNHNTRRGDRSRSRNSASSAESKPDSSSILYMQKDIKPEDGEEDLLK